MPNTSSSHNRSKHNTKTNPFLPWVVFFSLLLIIASGVLIYLVQFNAKATTGVDYSIGLNAQLGFDCDFSEAQRLYPFSDGLMKVTASRVAFLSVTGNEIFTVDISMEVPMQAQSENYFVVADQDGFAYALFNQDGIVYYRHTEGMISFVTVSDEGVVGLITDVSDAFGSVCIIDSEGNQAAQWTSFESGYPLSLDYSPDGRILNVSLVDINRSQMQPNIKQLYIPVDLREQKPYEYGHYSPDVSNILSVAAWIDNQTLLVSGISDVVCSRDGQIIPFEVSYANIINVFETDYGGAIIYSNGVGQELRIEHIYTSLERTETVVLGNHIKAYATDRELIIIAIDDRLIYYDIENGAIDKTLEIDEEIIRMMLRDEKVVLVTTSGVREISI